MLPHDRADRQLQRHQPHPPPAPARALRDGSHQREPDRVLSARGPGVHTTRRRIAGTPEAATAACAAARSPAVSGGGSRRISAEFSSRTRWSSSRNGRPVVDPHRLERRPAAQHRPRRRPGSAAGGVNDAATEHGESKRRVRGEGTGMGSRLASALEERRWVLRQPADGWNAILIWNDHDRCPARADMVFHNHTAGESVIRAWPPHAADGRVINTAPPGRTYYREGLVEEWTATATHAKEARRTGSWRSRPRRPHVITSASIPFEDTAVKRNERSDQVSVAEATAAWDDSGSDAQAPRPQSVRRHLPTTTGGRACSASAYTALAPALVDRLPR